MYVEKFNALICAPQDTNKSRNRRSLGKILLVSENRIFLVDTQMEKITGKDKNRANVGREISCG